MNAMKRTAVAMGTAAMLLAPAVPATAADADSCYIHRDPVVCACVAVATALTRVTGDEWMCAGAR